MTVRAWVYIYSIFSTALLISLVAAFSFWGLKEPNWVAFGTLTALAVASQIYEAEGTFRNTYYLHYVFFLAAVLLVEPLLFIGVVTIPHLVEWLIKRLKNHNNLRAWYIQPFNIATHIIAGYTAYWVYLIADNRSGLSQTPFHVLIVLLIALTYTLINHFLVGLALLLARGLSFHQSGILSSESLLPDIVLGCLGYVMVVLWKTEPWLIIPALSTLVLMAEALKIPQLKQDAQTDAKTGLLNAKYFNKIFTSDLEQAQRFKRPLSVIMADLDYMRNINNTYGHLAGDVVLAEIGKIIRRTIPDENTAGRFGGEEFAIVLPGVGREAAREIAERLRSAVEAARFEVSTHPEPIRATMSVGVATFPQDGTGETELTHAADVAVYHAKHTGRNRVVSAYEVPKWVIAEIASSKDETTTTAETSLVATLSEGLSPDVLTSLPDQASWLSHLNLALSQEKREHKGLGLMLIDLNRFNLINNSLQQPIGEQLLRAFVERVRTCIRKPDLLTRLSSTEFILLVEGVKSPNALTGLAERILAVLEAPVEVADQLYYLSASVGLVFTDQTRQDASEVLRNLQLALEAAKQRPNSAYVCFEPALREQTLAKIELERELRQALDAGQFEVYYQPKYELSTGRMEGMEALLRWKHPIRGFISPSEFIPLAEETGVINRLGQWVLTEAARQISIWNSFPFVTSSTFTPLVMSVNLSPVQARQPNLVEQVAAILEETGVDPAWLQLEITESLLIEPLPPVQETLSRLKALGLKLAIDDFGTGYSSLSYLKHFSLDTLKIDRTFIAELSKDNESRAIVQTIIQLGQALKLKVVAEGVESIEELLHLKRLGCDFAQGYYFARPLPASDLAPLLQSKKNQVVNLIA